MTPTERVIERNAQKRRYQAFKDAAKRLAAQGVPVEVSEHSAVQFVEGGAYVDAMLFVSDAELKQNDEP